jgi:glucose-6-phosphate 1-dehydrogenase
MQAALETSPDFDEAVWKPFSAALYYESVHYGDPSTFERLAEKLKEYDRSGGTQWNRIIYLSIPPTIYQPTVSMLGKAGLGVEEAEGKGWSRIVIEKPFGRDLDTAMELDKSIHEYFRESQIYRIDHYLAKETVQNILMFRFANAIFEPVWNRRYVDHIRITTSETLGVEHRAGYYEQSGVLRDMFQNHMMQVLSMVTMEPPSLFEADRVRDEKVKVYRSLRPFPLDRLNDYLVLGQYGPGSIDEQEVPGYREEPGVNPQSLVPTYAAMKVYIDNWRWQGVPIYMISGKRLAEKRTEIVLEFKEIPHSMFRQTLGETISANCLILGVYPEERITLTFQTKNPGAKVHLRSVTMDFNYHQNYQGPILEAYEKVILDVMAGSQMLFWRQDGVELCWSFLTPILIECETCGDRARNLYPYPAGSWGPEEVSRILES